MESANQGNAATIVFTVTMGTAAEHPQSVHSILKGAGGVYICYNRALNGTFCHRLNVFSIHLNTGSSK